MDEDEAEEAWDDEETLHSRRKNKEQFWDERAGREEIFTSGSAMTTVDFQASTTILRFLMMNDDQYCTSGQGCLKCGLSANNMHMGKNLNNLDGDKFGPL